MNLCWDEPTNDDMVLFLFKQIRTVKVSSWDYFHGAHTSHTHKLMHAQQMQAPTPAHIFQSFYIPDCVSTYN